MDTVATAATRSLPLPLLSEPTYGWVVGELALASGARRHWVEAGLPRDRLIFGGYWRAHR